VKITANRLSAAVCAGFAASTFVHIRGLAGTPGAAWPLVLLASLTPL
jgi:hypothetical protein